MQEVQVVVGEKEGRLQGGEVEFAEGLRMVRVDRKLKQLYSTEEGAVMKHVMLPVEMEEEEDSLLMIVGDYGEPVSSLKEFQYEQLQKQQFLQQILQIFHHAYAFAPALTPSSILYIPKRPIKVLPIQTCSSEVQYLEHFRTLISKIYSTNQNILLRCAQTKEIPAMQIWWQEVRHHKTQGKSIPQLLELKAEVHKQAGPRIDWSEDDQLWVFKALGIEKMPKLQQVYEGVSSLFDPETFLKAIDKRRVVILLQTTPRKRVAFGSVLRIEYTPNGIFGHYLPDQRCKSMIFDLNSHSVHPLKDPKHAIGLGPQILLSIGYCDIVLGAFNMSNVCLFPVRYQREEGSKVTADELIGGQFVLRQMEVWAYEQTGVEQKQQAEEQKIKEQALKL